MIAEVSAHVSVVGWEPVRWVGGALGAIDRPGHGAQASRVVEVVAERDQPVRLPRPGARVVGLLQCDDVLSVGTKGGRYVLVGCSRGAICRSPRTVVESGVCRSVLRI